MSKRVDYWETKCSECGKTLGDWTWYIETRDGRMSDGSATVLISSVVCSPRCLILHAEGITDND